VTSPATLRALQAVVVAIRPGWDGAGVHSALLAADRAGYPLPRIAAAAIDAAATPTTRTPAGIGERLRVGWAGADLDRPPLRDPARAAPPIAEVWREQARHGKPAPDEHRRAALAEARRGIAATSTPEAR
jgi:hypothetical protein